VTAVDMQLTEFGQVLVEFMEEKGVPAEPNQVRALAERAGLDPENLLARVTRTGEHEGYLDKLANELDLRDDLQWVRLAKSYAFERFQEKTIEHLMGEYIGLNRHEAEMLAHDHDLWADPEGLVPKKDEEAVEQWGEAAYLAWELSEMANNTHMPLGNDVLIGLMADAGARAEEAARRARKRLEKKKAE
jgi:hypothetical protein